jgi:hypothetical protein
MCGKKKKKTETVKVDRISSQMPNSGSWKPAYQNKFAFRHNKNSKKTKKILALKNEGLCRTCTEQIEWRKRYRKYKPMTQPASW